MRLEITEKKLAYYGTALLMLISFRFVLDYLPRNVAVVLGSGLYIPSWIAGNAAWRASPLALPREVYQLAVTFAYYLVLLALPAALRLRWRHAHWLLPVVPHAALTVLGIVLRGSYYRQLECGCGY